MSNHNPHRVRTFTLLAGCLFAVSTLASTCLNAQTAHQPLPGALSGPASTPAHSTNYVELADKTASTDEQKGSHEGVKMHGHWVIDVRNPDGTLVQHRDFENSIQYDGQNYLVGLLSGYAVAGDYEIYFANATASTTNAVCTSGQFPYCAIVQSTTTQPGAFACSVYTCVGGLTVTPTFGVGPTLKLAGTLTAPNAGSIAFVGTGMDGCGIATTGTNGYPTGISTSTPGQCEVSTTSSFSGTMTSTTLTSPVSVVSGQIIQISVTLSFS